MTPCSRQRLTRRVYDGACADNRKYSGTYSLRPAIRIGQLMAKTSDHFRVELRTQSQRWQ